MTKILAIDPAMAATGLAVMERQSAGNWEPVELLCVRTSRSDAKVNMRMAHDDVRRIREQLAGIRTVVRRHEIKRIVAELPDCGARDQRSAVAMAYVRAMVAAIYEFDQDMAIEFYTPRETRLAATGRADPTKRHVMECMEHYYPDLAQIKTLAEREHVADALSTFEAAKRGNLVRMT